MLYVACIILGAALASAAWYVYVRGLPGVKADLADVKADVSKVEAAVTPTPTPPVTPVK